jgi:outer membrane protein assembly factor BamB
MGMYVVASILLVGGCVALLAWRRTLLLRRRVSLGHRQDNALWKVGVVLDSSTSVLASVLSACGGTMSVYRPPQSDKWTLYFATSDGSVHALNANDGSQRWKASSKTGVSPAFPVTVDDKIVAITNARQGIVALRADTGGVVKTCDCVGPVNTVGPPTIVDGVLYSVDASP